MGMRKLRALAATVTLLLVLVGCTPATPRSDVGIQLFVFNWDSVARECEQALGPAGIGWVLISPPQEHLADEPWWVHYQPVSYKLESRLGTSEQFARMVKTCNESGVAVIVDAVINHMAGRQSGTGWLGEEFEKYRYRDLYDESDFHRCTITASGKIESYSDQQQVQTCDLLGLADLDTSNPAVQSKIVSYLSGLLDLGVAGFRIDAAKHINPLDLKQIIDQLPPQTIIYHEVIRGAGEPIQPEQYTDTGLVWEFALSSMLQGAALSDWAPELSAELISFSFLPSDRAISFVTNHDTERNGKSLSPQRDEVAFALASYLILASDYGTPMLYSGYAFEEFDSPPILEPTGMVADANCELAAEPRAGSWLCQHRSEKIASMISWRIATQGQPVSDFYWDNEVTAFSRGAAGFFAINFGSSPKSLNIQTSLVAGEYCNKLAADCESFKISQDGKIETVIEPYSAIALSR
jgi:alpha-amylase